MFHVGFKFVAQSLAEMRGFLFGVLKSLYICQTIKINTMKTIKQVKAEIEVLKISHSQVEKESAQKKIEKQIRLLRSCIMYLETNPRIEFIRSEKTRIKKVIDSYLDSERFEEWEKSNWPFLKAKMTAENPNPKTAYAKECGIPYLRKSLRTLEYLLQ